MLASVIIDRARTTLIDPDAVTWSDDELLDYLSAAQRAICQIKTDAYTIKDFIPLVSGVSQELPDNGLQLLDVYRNASGTTINQVGRELLNNANRQWVSATPDADVDEFMTDERDPRRFMVSPPNNGSGSIEVLYGAIPPELTGTGGSIVVKDTYDMALWAMTVSQALAKNGKRQDLSKSQQFMQLFFQLVTGRTQSQRLYAPKLELPEQQ